MSGQKQHKTHSPTITEMISLEVPNLVKISPERKKVAYTIEKPNWKENVYEKTAPISNITQAKTPTLIQHGEGDARAPVSCAKELYRRLQEVDVPVELFIYPDMEHRITRPKENRAIMYQNLNWFSHYIFGEELDLIPESAENI